MLYALIIAKTTGIMLCPLATVYLDVCFFMKETDSICQ